MHNALISLAMAWALAHGAPIVQDYVYGIFVSTPDGPVELIAWAEPTRSGQLTMASGTLEDVPTIANVGRILCNLPTWKPATVIIATKEIFRDERAERRELPFASRRINNSALELRVEDLEHPDRLAQRLHNVRASDRAPGYAFVVVSGPSDGLVRFYPFRVNPPPPK